jgi:hypothetical protein
MSQRTLIEANHDKLCRLIDDNGVVAELLFGALSGEPEAADRLAETYGLRIISQHRNSDSVVVQVNGNNVTQIQRT